MVGSNKCNSLQLIAAVKSFIEEAADVSSLCYQVFQQDIICKCLKGLHVLYKIDSRIKTKCHIRNNALDSLNNDSKTHFFNG